MKIRFIFIIYSWWMIEIKSKIKSCIHIYWLTTYISLSRLNSVYFSIASNMFWVSIFWVSLERSSPISSFPSWVTNLRTPRIFADENIISSRSTRPSTRKKDISNPVAYPYSRSGVMFRPFGYLEYGYATGLLISFFHVQGLGLICGYYVGTFNVCNLLLKKLRLKYAFT